MMIQANLILKIIMISFLILYCLGCDNCQKNIFSIEEIKNFSVRKDGIPPSDGGLILFVNVGLKKLGVIQKSRLITLYNDSQYSKIYNNPYNFLFEALNQKILFDSKNILENGGFIINKDCILEKEYKEKGLNGILQKYFTMEGINFYLKKSDIDRTKKYTLLFFCFINKFKIREDEYIGLHIVSRPEK
ncbi:MULTISPECIES: hypothetical protein [unclassified Arcicella]|uniref:hypothetical protein n=1 Tax=unclassified Arcicella TaxID=2644986 RepID=UPI00285C7E88|nr:MULTISPECIES: hypothetical protein [unclassified Arcicella]MDR6563431.1 hypothetical protein [Arcicella sp. BE51]MDR6813457.1 hypothetical protein [Arcicella sp. BE140]MDR6824770.1 hypothetical protein [Arcicella sp. BE139]